MKHNMENNLIQQDDAAQFNKKLTDDQPRGFHLEHNAISTQVWNVIEHWLSSNMLPASINNNEPTKNNLIHVPIPWQAGSQGRRVAQFGSCKYDYINDDAVLCDPSTMIPIPTYIRQVLLENEDDGEHYSQCIINVYDAQNIIPWHVDHNKFGEKVLVYTFGEERPLLLRTPISHKDDKSIVYGSIGLPHPEEEYTFHTTRVYPRHCSKYILEGSARNDWEHSVPAGSGKRVSITFRSWRGQEE